MTETRFGTFDELLDGVDEEMALVARELRGIVFEVDPGSVEVVRPGDRAATYGVGPKKMTEGYAYIIPQQRHVNLGFYRGTSLEDPEELMEGTGKAMRHVKVQTIDDARGTPLRELIRAARQERIEALG